MRNTFFLFTFCVILVACSSDNNNTRLLSYSNKEENILDDFYQELKAQRPELQALEKEINEVDQAKHKVLQEYATYNSKNQQGYSIALRQLENIEDSLLRNSVELLINKSKYAYEQDNAAMDLASATLENRSTSLHDHHQALKILVALNLMEKYQKKQTLNAAEYEKVILRYNTTIHKTDSLLQVK